MQFEEMMPWAKGAVGLVDEGWKGLFVLLWCQHRGARDLRNGLQAGVTVDEPRANTRSGTLCLVEIIDGVLLGYRMADAFTQLALGRRTRAACTFIVGTVVGAVM